MIGGTAVLSPCCNTCNYILEDHTVSYSGRLQCFFFGGVSFFLCPQKNTIFVVIILSWTQEDASGGYPDCFYVPIVANSPFFLLQFMRCFENHHVVAFEELRNSHEAIPIHKPIFCDVHLTENMKFFCLSCQVIRYNVNGACVLLVNILENSGARNLYCVCVRNMLTWEVHIFSTVHYLYENLVSISVL
jgi:hypothetical protein